MLHIDGLVGAFGMHISLHDAAKWLKIPGALTQVLSLVPTTFVPSGLQGGPRLQRQGRGLC